MINPEGQSSMHCGDSSCLIQQDWYCECSAMPETSMMSRSDGKGDDELSEGKEKGYIEGAILVGVCVVALAGVLYWLWCRKSANSPLYIVDTTLRIEIPPTTM